MGGSRRAILLASALLVATVTARAAELPSFMDGAFGYPPTVWSGYGGDYRVIAYDALRDARRADAAGDQIRPPTVSLGVRDVEADLGADPSAGTPSHIAVGRSDGASLIVVYIHGRGANRKSGVDDFTFGGNFNRLKNLVVAAGGVYLSPDFANFGDRGTSEVATLVERYAAASPGAPVVIACGSAGGALCWSLAKDPVVAPRLAGLALLASLPDDGFLSSAAFARRVPVFLGHGSRDTVLPVKDVATFFQTVREAAPDYPMKLYVFEAGTHRTPLVMVDWRDAINWMLSAR
jgi:pimeloyl-ACP methyl ester carboxylesterase